MTRDATDEAQAGPMPLREMSAGEVRPMRFAGGWRPRPADLPSPFVARAERPARRPERTPPASPAREPEPIPQDRPTPDEEPAMAKGEAREIDCVETKERWPSGLDLHRHLRRGGLDISIGTVRNRLNDGRPLAGKTYRIVGSGEPPTDGDEKSVAATPPEPASPPAAEPEPVEPAASSPPAPAAAQETPASSAVPEPTPAAGRGRVRIAFATCEGCTPEVVAELVERLGRLFVDTDAKGEA